MRRTLRVLLLAGLLVIITAAPASAHARLVATDPAEDAVLPERPAAVRFTFDQAVQTVSDGVTLYAADRPPRPLPATVVGETLQVSLPDDLEPGTVLIGWQVRSEDAHPISGVLEFSIGRRGPPPIGPQVSTADRVEPIRIAVQALAYLGLLTAIGLAVLDAVAASVRGAPRQSRKARLRLERIGAVVAIAGMIGLVVLAAATGAPIFAPLQVVLLAVSGLVLIVAVPDRGAVTGRIVVAVGAGIAAASSLPLGHSRTKEPAWLMLPADLLHVLTGGIWLGGLIGLVMLLGLARPSDGPGQGDTAEPLARVLSRFSVLAGAALVALAVTGTVQTLLILPEPRALVETGYGRVLLVKIGLTAVAAAIAADNHFRLVPRIRAAAAGAAPRVAPAPRIAGASDHGTAPVRMLRRAAINEAAILGLAVVTAGVLVGLSPNLNDPGPGPAEGVDRAQSFTARLDDLTVEGRVDPGRVGGNAVEWTIVDSTGRNARIVEVPRLRAFHRASGLGPIDGTTTSDTAGSYRSALDLPLAGTWRIEVSARVSEFAEPVTEVEVEIVP